MKKLTVWDVFTFLGLLGAVSLLIVFAQIFINPQVAFNPLPPPTMVPTLGIPTSTPTLKSLPPTWTPPPDEENRGTHATLRPSQTGPPPSATVPVLSTFTAAPTNIPTSASLPKTTERPTAISQPTATALKTNTPLSANTALPDSFATPTKTILPAMLTNTPLPTQTARISQPSAQPTSAPTTKPTFIPTTKPTAETPPDTSSIVWKATHEDGDLREWQEHGDFITQGKSAYYNMITSPVHGGNYAVSLTIDTEGFSNSDAYAAYLFYWDQLPGDAYYYSAWYYIPEGTQPPGLVECLAMEIHLQWQHRQQCAHVCPGYP